MRTVVHGPAPLSAQEVAKMESTLAPVPGRLHPELRVGGQANREEPAWPRKPTRNIGASQT